MERCALAKLAEKEHVSSSEAIDLARKQGMAEMSEKFRALGGEVYVALDDRMRS